MPTYRLYHEGKPVFAEARHESARRKPDRRRDLETNLPTQVGTNEIHGAVFRLDPNAPEKITACDLTRTPEVWIDGEKVFDLQEEGSDLVFSEMLQRFQEKYPEKDQADKHNNPAILLIAHSLMQQNVFCFAPIQYIRDDISAHNHQIKFDVGAIKFSKDKNGATLMTLHFAADALQDMEDVGDEGFRKRLDSGKTDVPHLCEVTCTIKLTTVADHLAARLPYYGRHHDLPAVCVHTDVMKLDVKVNELPGDGQDNEALYQYAPNTLGAYRAAANPQPGSLSQFCGCVFSAPQPMPGLVVNEQEMDVFAKQPS